MSSKAPKALKPMKAPKNKSRRGRRPRNVPAAFNSSFRRPQSMIQNRNGRTTLTFREIFPVTIHDSTVNDLMLPFTPTKWPGTRTAILSSTYTAFRPRQVRLIWRSSRGTSNSGLVAVGTIFDGASATYNNKDAGMQVLSSSNGGFITNIWKPHSSVVATNTALRANTFPTYNTSADDIPFWILVIATGLNDGTPIGYLEIQSTITLHNPINTPSAITTSNYIPYVITAAAEGESHATLSLATSDITSALSVGRDYWLVFAKNLVNAAGQELLTRTLQFVTAEFSQTNDANSLFKIDPNFAASAGFCRLIGSAPENF